MRIKTLSALMVLLLFCATAHADSCQAGAVASILGTTCSIGGVTFNFGVNPFLEKGASGYVYTYEWDPNGDVSHPGAGAFVQTRNDDIDLATVLFIPLSNGSAGFTLQKSLSFQTGDETAYAFFKLYLAATADDPLALITSITISANEASVSSSSQGYEHIYYDYRLQQNQTYTTFPSGDTQAFGVLCNYTPQNGCLPQLASSSRKISISGTTYDDSGSNSYPRGYGGDHSFSYGEAGFSSYASEGGAASIDGATFLYQTTTPVPEPASIALLGSGLLGLAGAFRRKFIVS